MCGEAPEGLAGCSLDQGHGGIELTEPRAGADHLILGQLLPGTGSPLSLLGRRAQYNPCHGSQCLPGDRLLSYSKVSNLPTHRGPTSTTRCDASGGKPLFLRPEVSLHIQQFPDPAVLGQTTLGCMRPSILKLGKR